MLPNGLIANLTGPYEGKRQRLASLRQVAFHNHQPLCLDGDATYPLGINLQAPVRNRELTPEMREFNKAMSAVRVSVEWMFGNITKYFSIVDFKRQMKVNLSAIGQMRISPPIYSQTFQLQIFE